MTHRLHEGGEDGFTLTEVAVVAIILSILAAIAITTYFVQVAKTERGAARSHLGDLDTVALSIQSDLGTYSDDPALYREELPRLDFLPDGISDVPEEISVSAPASGAWVSFAAAGGGQCFYLRFEGVGQGKAMHHEALGDGDDCTATDYPQGDPRNDGWQ